MTDDFTHRQQTTAAHLQSGLCTNAEVNIRESVGLLTLRYEIRDLVPILGLVFLKFLFKFLLLTYSINMSQVIRAGDARRLYAQVISQAHPTFSFSST